MRRCNRGIGSVSFPDLLCDSDRIFSPFSVLHLPPFVDELLRPSTILAANALALGITQVSCLETLSIGEEAKFSNQFMFLTRPVCWVCGSYLAVFLETH
jgi:hypothetical protein